MRKVLVVLFTLLLGVAAIMSGNQACYGSSDLLIPVGIHINQSSDAMSFALNIDKTFVFSSTVVFAITAFLFLSAVVAQGIYLIIEYRAEMEAYYNAMKHVDESLFFKVDESRLCDMPEKERKFAYAQAKAAVARRDMQRRGVKERRRIVIHLPSLKKQKASSISNYLAAKRAA